MFEFDFSGDKNYTPLSDEQVAALSRSHELLVDSDAEFIAWNAMSDGTIDLGTDAEAAAVRSRVAEYIDANRDRINAQVREAQKHFTTEKSRIAFLAGVTEDDIDRLGGLG